MLPSRLEFAYFPHITTQASLVRRRILSLVLGFVIASAGCRYNDPSVDMLESELRWMEDQMYELEDQLDQACVDLNRAKADYSRDLASCEQKVEAHRNTGNEDLTPTADPQIELPNAEVAPPMVIMPDGSVFPDDPPAISPTETYELPSDLSPQPAIIAPTEEINSVDDIPDEHELPAPVSTPASSGSSDFGDLDLEPTPAENPSSPTVPEQPTPSSPAAGVRPKLAPNTDSNEKESDNRNTPGTPSLPDAMGDDLESLFDKARELPAPANDQTLRLIPAVPQLSAPAHDKYSIRLQSHVTSEPILKSPLEKSNIDAHITHIVMQAHRTAKAEDGSGHDLEILVQPRNADGHYVSLPAKISVVVLDDDRKGNEARVARWDLNANETSRQFRSTERGEGIHLQFDWPNDQVLGDNLHAYVRYTTVDGRRLQSQQFLKPLEPVRSPADEGWSVVGQSKPMNGWQVLPIAEAGEGRAYETSTAVVSELPPPETTQSQITTAPTSRIIKASATEEITFQDQQTPAPQTPSTPQAETRIKAPLPSGGQWKLVPVEQTGPAKPNLLPAGIPTQPILQATPQVPASVPEWSPRR